MEKFLVEMEGEIEVILVPSIDDHQILVVDLDGSITLIQIDRMLTEETEKKEEEDRQSETTKLFLFVFGSPIQVSVMFPIPNGQETFDGHQHLSSHKRTIAGQVEFEKMEMSHLLCTN